MTDDEAPAASLTSIQQKAKADLGEFGPKARSNNASKSAHAFVNRWGLSWRVPLTDFVSKDKDNHDVLITYISPIDFVRYLLQNAPELLMGGVVNPHAGQDQLEAFWNAYEKAHPTHRLFVDEHPTRSKRNTIPSSFHGDEGRGRKKANTLVMMMEANLGVSTASHYRTNDRFDDCDYCDLRAPCAKRFKTCSGKKQGVAIGAPLCAFQAHNTKNNSFLTKFVLAVLPDELYKDTTALDVILERICEDFKSLFEKGLWVNNQQWFLACTGMKGDLKWYEKVANLDRCFNKQCGANLQMCHECEAGKEGMPWEDASHFPCWRKHLFLRRPWIVPPIILKIPFEQLQPEMILRRDLFHMTKVGILRDFVGSTVLLLVALRYFTDQGPGISNARDVCLTRAYKHFHLYCKTVGEKPGLRSFTPTFFNAKTSTDYGWINAKGSDVTILCKWIRVLCAGFLNDPVHPNHIPLLKRILAAAKCVTTWQHILYSHGCWLPKHCAMVTYQELHEFLQHYNALAFECLANWNFTGYGLKSKFHLIAHTKQDIAVLLDQPDVEWIMNPLVFAGEMNEDVVGKLSRLSRRTDSRLTSKRTLQLYLCKSKAIYRRFVKENRWTKEKA